MELLFVTKREKVLGCSISKLLPFLQINRLLAALEKKVRLSVRNIQLFKWRLHIPPLCHLNPFYNEFVMLRFRALSYLSDVCGEDVTRYCH